MTATTSKSHCTSGLAAAEPEKTATSRMTTMAA